MSRPTISVRGLGKRYRIGERVPYQSLREMVSQAVATSFRRRWGSGSPRSSQDAQHIWALRDVSFDVKPGEALGIIGPNGAGKSTLLKILSRITLPTEGRAEIRGRLGSLLEVGTGFHPELTGRENMFLNGAILGMRRAEIRRKFDEIVAFAELERFIDTPIKRYSSGMYVRLAFSVAAHMDLDILAVDEVLAVGDVTFQKKCLGKMEEVRGRQGRTVLFVSHSLGAVKLLTDSCLLVRQGRLMAHGPTNEVVHQYLQASFPTEETGVVDLTAPELRRGTPKSLALNLTFRSLRLANSRGEWTGVFYEREPITVELAFESKVQARSVELIIMVLTSEGTPIFSSFSGQRVEAIDPGRYTTTCVMDPNILRPGDYRLRLYLRSGTWQDVIAEATMFYVQANPLEPYEMTYGVSNPGLMGTVRVDYLWGAIQSVAEMAVGQS